MDGLGDSCGEMVWPTIGASKGCSFLWSMLCLQGVEGERNWPESRSIWATCEEPHRSMDWDSSGSKRMGTFQRSRLMPSKILDRKYLPTPRVKPCEILLEAHTGNGKQKWEATF